MENEHSEYVYSVKDLDKAFDMGLQTAIFVIEKSIDLTIKGQQQILESLKEMIEEDNNV